MSNCKKYFAGALFAGLLAGCSSDFIDRPPQDAIVNVNFYQTDDQVLAATAPLYNIVWFQYNDKASHGLGDGRGGILTSGSYQIENIEFRTTSTTAEVSTSWRSFYNVVGQANTLINNVRDLAGPGVSEEVRNHAIAEGRFMRGMAYYYLIMNWQEGVPIITDNTNNLQDTTLARNTPESVWEFICRDIRYGTEHLPETAVQEGRLTAWAAKGMLAKMYLTRSGLEANGQGPRNSTYLDSARILAKEVIDNSGASLMPEYEDLFKTANNNNQETLFALQWTYNGNWGSQNSVQAFLAYGSSITGFADGWGQDLSASLWMLDKYEGLTPGSSLVDDGNTVDERRKATFMFPGDHYPYIHQQLLDGDGNPYTQELVVPVGGNGYNTRAWVKKYVVGRPEDNNGRVLQQRTEIQTYMLRLADVYLIYAEAIMGNAASTSDLEAVKYFNMVRERAGATPITPTITWNDIFNERILEFAMEGQAWYEFVRWSYFDKLGAYSELSQQDRGFIRVTPDDAENPTSWTIIPDPNDNTRSYAVTDANFKIPYPEAEMARAPNLRKPAVPYTFD